MRMRVAATVLVACVGLVSGCSPSADDAGSTPLPEDVTSALETTLAETMREYDVPGAAVEVCAPGYEDWSYAAGLADRESGKEMTTDLVWPIRSVTKSFTVTALLMLVDEGKLSLDDPIDNWVPDVPNGDKITVGQLAAMTSGVPEYTTQAWVKDYTADPTKNFTDQELIAYALAEPAMFEPGKKAVYVNTSTVLLGEVVAQESGQSFAEVLQTDVLDPLGLTSTEYPATYDDWSGPHPTGYQPDEDGALEAQDNNFTVFGPSGAMTSTLPDLCRWAGALGTGELLNEETQRARLQGQKLAKGPEYDKYAQGIGIIDGWVGHTGEGFGHSLLVMHQPDTGTNVVVAMNIAATKDHVPTKYFRKIAPVLDELPGSTR